MLVRVGWTAVRSDRAQESSVPERGSARTIYFYPVLVMVYYLHDYSTPVPLLPPSPGLVRHEHHVRHLEGFEYFCVLGQNGTLSGVSACEGNFSLMSCEQPLGAGLEILGLNWIKVFDWVTKHDMCGALTGVLVWGVAVH